MSIRIKLLSSLGKLTGTTSVELDANFNTLDKAMNELWRLYPELRKEMLYRDGTMDFIYQIILNGERVVWPDDKDIKLKDKAQIALMVFMAGG